MVTVTDVRAARETSRKRHGSGNVAQRLLCVVAAIGLWQVFVQSGAVSSDAIAAPTEVAHALGSMAMTLPFWFSVGATVRTWAVGLAAAIAIAVPLGLLLGSSDVLYRMFRVTIDFLRTIPPVALLPVTLLLYGATEQMAISLIVFGSVWPMLLQSMYGVHQVDPTARDVAKAYRLRRRELILAVILPSAAPFIATGIRISATISLLLAVGAGLIGGAPGIGASITAAQLEQDIPRMFAFVVVGAVMGMALNLTMIRAERNLLSWHTSHRGVVAS